MFLGLDLGTSGLRALLVDASGTPVASAEQTYTVSRPHPGWSEQNPADWVVACHSVINALRESHPAEIAATQAIAVAGHMHGAVLLDAKSQIIRPCILWNDTRSHTQAAELDADPDFRAITGNIVFPGFTAPKLVWLQKHEPEIFARVAKVILPKDYLTFLLTGRVISEMSDAAGTAWLSVGDRGWSQVLIEKSGMLRGQMPDLVEGSTPIGNLRTNLAAQWGMSSNVIIVAGAGDNAAAACGVGAINEGDGFISLGTSGVLLAAKNTFAPDAKSAVHSFCHAIPNRWIQMGVTLAATDSLNWLSGIIGQSPQALTTTLGPKISPPGKIQFLPYLSGERTPHNDSNIRGAFLGLDISTDQTDLTRAVLEGVSFALRDSLEAMISTGTKLDRLIAIGGGTASEYWVKLLATILNVPIQLPKSGEFGAALGAARLAICGATNATPFEIMTTPEIEKTVYPDTDFLADYQHAYQKFRKTYPAIKAIQ